MRVRTYYTARRVATQANAAGGAVVVDITPAAGQALRVISISAANSGTNSLYGAVLDEDNSPTGLYIAGLTSAAGTNWNVPSIGASAAADNNLANSQYVLVTLGQKLSCYQAGAGAQNDTLTVAVVLELIGNPATPTWDVSRSTNAGDVTLAASTISAANSIVAVTEP